MKKINLNVPNQHGDKLRVTVEMPSNGFPTHYALYAHCFTCTSNIKPAKNISQSLTEQGFACVRFDFTGLGRSKGEFKNSHFKANVSDIIHVHNYIKENYKAPEILIGHSLGGTAAIMAAAELEDIKGVVTIGSPSNTDHTKKHFSEDKREPADENGDIKVQIDGRPFVINQEFIDAFDGNDVQPVAKKLRRPLLIFHSPIDNTVSIENAQRIYRAAHHPKSFVSLDQADHLLMQKDKDSFYIGEIIGAWSKLFFAEEKIKSIDKNGEQTAAYLNFKKNTYTTQVQAGNHLICADEPVSAGGHDFGPSPYELLNASLASCSSITLKMYAERKKIDLEEIFVYVSHEKVPITAADGTQKVEDYFTKKIKLVGNLSEEQKLRMKEISSRCPVHRTLQNDDVHIQTELI